MGNLSWTHLILAVLIILFAKTTWLVIVLAAILVVLSILGISSCNAPAPNTARKIRAAPRKKAKKKKAKKRK
tara:strand:- start:263 stop:478 length:216 start_codon:yes stop_codon:yes gene_type:complete